MEGEVEGGKGGRDRKQYIYICQGTMAIKTAIMNLATITCIPITLESL